MRSLALLAALTSVASAQPEQLPAKFKDAASDAFAKAQAAEQAGKLQEAIKQYERAIEIAPHPNTYFNLAELHRANKSYDAAIASYQKYLELAPQAANREAVEKRVRDLIALPGTLEISTDEPYAVMFVNGKPSGKPRNLDVPAGSYQIDIVTPITFGGNVCSVSRGQSSSCKPPTRARVDGNVVISAQWPITGQSFSLENQGFLIRGRFVAKPGHYDLGSHASACDPLPLEVPSGDGLTYAYIAYATDKSQRSGCQLLTITQHQVSFPK